MRAERFSVETGENDTIVIDISPPPNVTSSGKPSYYNGLLVKYYIAGANKNNSINGTQQIYNYLI